MHLKDLVWIGQPHAVRRDEVKKNKNKVQLLGLEIKQTAETCVMCMKDYMPSVSLHTRWPTQSDGVNRKQDPWADERGEADVNTRSVSARLPRAGFTTWRAGYYHNLHAGKMATNLAITAAVGWQYNEQLIILG